MWCEKTNKYYLTRDLVFLHRIYYKRYEKRNEIIIEPLKIVIIKDNCMAGNTDTQMTENKNTLKVR